MSTILKEMRDDRIAAMKEKDSATKTVLTTFIGEMQSQQKRGIEITNAYVIGQIKKVVQSNEDLIAIKEDSKYQFEIDVLSEYLPKQLTSVELSNIIDCIVLQQESPNVGSVMKTLKNGHSGLYDGKEAASIVKSRLG